MDRVVRSSEMWKVINVAVLFVSGLGVEGRIAPSFIYPCPVLTPYCLKNTIQRAIPEFVKGDSSIALDSLDPLHRNVSQFEAIPGFWVSLVHGKLTGLRNCNVDTARYSNDKKTLDFKLHCNITLRGKYKASGKLLVVDINGDGDAKIKCKNVYIHAKLKFEDAYKNGNLYYVLKDYNVRHRYDGRVTYSMANLFKGNPELSKAVLHFLNANWKLVSDEIGSPVMNVGVRYVLEVIKNFFNIVPKNELFPYRLK